MLDLKEKLGVTVMWHVHKGEGLQEVLGVVDLDQLASFLVQVELLGLVDAMLFRGAVLHDSRAIPQEDVTLDLTLGMVGWFPTIPKPVDWLESLLGVDSHDLEGVSSSSGCARTLHVGVETAGSIWLGLVDRGRKIYILMQRLKQTRKMVGSGCIKEDTGVRGHLNPFCVALRVFERPKECPLMI